MVNLDSVNLPFALFAKVSLGIVRWFDVPVDGGHLHERLSVLFCQNFESSSAARSGRTEEHSDGYHRLGIGLRRVDFRRQRRFVFYLRFSKKLMSS